MKKTTQPARRKTAAAIPGKKPSPPAGKPRSTGGPFPIVGIGASAGGLEALELFLRNVPQGSGMAFVIVQHLDPTHKGVMPELLQRATAMEVVQVKDRTRVEPDRVYVIPPNKDMSILHRVLHLLDPAAPRGLRLPIDFFFRSLADDLEELSIGVILSEWFSVRIMPYRTVENMIDGVVITFADITTFKALEAELRTTQSGMEKHIAEQDVRLERAGTKSQEEKQRGQRDAGSGAGYADTKDKAP